MLGAGSCLENADQKLCKLHTVRAHRLRFPGYSVIDSQDRTFFFSQASAKSRNA